MIFDYQNLFSNDQAITADAASTNVIKAQSLAGADSGPGEPINLDVRVTTAFATLTSLDISVQTDDDEAFGTAVTLSTTNALAAALVVGYKLPVVIMPSGLKKYVRLYYNVNGSDATAGKIMAGVVASPHTTVIGG